MEIKLLEDILTLRDEFSRNLEKRMKTLERPAAGTAEQLIEEKRALVKQSRAAMAAAERSKAAMVKRLDDEVGRHKQTVERLERELGELTKAAKGGGAGKGDAIGAAGSGGTAGKGGAQSRTRGKRSEG